MKELGITKGECTDDGVCVKIDGELICTVVEQDMYNKDIEGHANANLITNAFNTANKCNLLPSELLQRYNEAIEVLENVKRLETLIRYPDDVSIMHEGEAKAIHMMLKDVEQTISKAKGE